MRAFGQQLDAEGVDIARLVKGLRPPGATLDQGLTDGGRGGAIHIEDDGLLHRRARCARIGLLQPETAGQTADHRLIQIGGEVRHHDLGRSARARVVQHRVEAVVRQTDERVAHRQGDRARFRRDARQLGPRLVAGEGLDRLELDIVGEDQGLVGVEIAQGRRGLERAQSRPLQAAHGVDRVAFEEARQVHADRSVRARLDHLAGPDHRGREGGGDRVHLVGVGVHGAKAGVLERSEDAIADLAENHDLGLTQTRAVQPGSVHAQPRRQTRLIEVAPQHPVRAGRRQAHACLALLPVQLHAEQAVLPGRSR
ncbi:hypothetical protein D3C80_1151870 [compost metagenome]